MLVLSFNINIVECKFDIEKIKEDSFNEVLI